jgi:hypothetical protein
MKSKGFSIGIIFLVLMVCTTCTKDEALLTPDGELSALKSAPVENELSEEASLTKTNLHGRIAFHSTRDGDFEIFVMNADGTGVTQLTHNTVGDRPGNTGQSGSSSHLGMFYPD